MYEAQRLNEDRDEISTEAVDMNNKSFNAFFSLESSVFVSLSIFKSSTRLPSEKMIASRLCPILLLSALKARIYQSSGICKFVFPVCKFFSGTF